MKIIYKIADGLNNSNTLKDYIDNDSKLWNTSKTDQLNYKINSVIELIEKLTSTLVEKELIEYSEIVNCLQTVFCEEIVKIEIK